MALDDAGLFLVPQSDIYGERIADAPVVLEEHRVIFVTIGPRPVQLETAGGRQAQKE